MDGMLVYNNVLCKFCEFSHLAEYCNSRSVCNIGVVVPHAYFVQKRNISRYNKFLQWHLILVICHIKIKPEFTCIYRSDFGHLTIWHCTHYLLKPFQHIIYYKSVNIYMLSVPIFASD